MTQKDKSWQAPETTAFKNIKPGDLPKSTYTYKGQDVGNQGNLPNMDGQYKGQDVGKGKNLPDKNYTYKGDSSVGKGKNTEK